MEKHIETRWFLEPFGVEEAKVKKFLNDLKDNPFLALVIYDDGSVSIYDKGIGTPEAALIKEVIEETLSERRGNGSSQS